MFSSQNMRVFNIYLFNLPPSPPTHTCKLFNMTFHLFFDSRDVWSLALESLAESLL